MSKNLLFENLMALKDTKKVNTSKKPVKESDETVLNVNIELPSDKDVEELEPDDVDVNVGITYLDEIENEETDEELNTDSIDEAELEDAEVDILEDSLEIDIDITEDVEEDEEPTDIVIDINDDVLELQPEIMEEKIKATRVKKALENAKRRRALEAKRKAMKTKKEALMNMDTNSLNKLVSSFVKDNYKNIDKVVFSRAILEKTGLTVKGTIIAKSGKTENIALRNIGFNKTKLEGKRFLIDFKDATNTFKSVKESANKSPFVFEATLKNNTLNFNKLKYNFITKTLENKQAKVFGAIKLNENRKRK